MILNLNVTIRNNQLQDIITALDAGVGAGKFLLYTGPKPAAGAAITTETLLGTCVLSTPCATVSNGVLTFSAISDDISADANGTIGWVRGLTGSNVWVLDMDAGNAISSAAIKFDTVDVTVGVSIRIISGTFTAGNA